MNFAPLADVANIFMGQSPPGSTYNTDGNGLPFFQGKTDFGDIYPTVRMYCTEPKRIAEINDILISVRAPVGPTNLAPIKSAIGRGLAAIRCKDGTDVKYLLYFLRHNESKLSQLGTGSTFEAIGRDDLEDVNVPLPPLPEQRRIAALLDKADHLRRTRRYAAQLSDSFLQAVFVRMFGNSGEVQRTIIQELLDEGAILDLQDGNHGEAHPRQSDFVTDGIPFLTATHVIDGQVFLNRVPRISHEKAKQLRIGWVEPYDVLLAHNATVGRVAVLPNFEGRVVIGTSLTYYRLNQTRFNPAYFAEALRSRAFQSQLEQSMGQSTRNQVPITRQKELWVPVAPLALQEKFAHIVQQFERLRAQQREAERQAEHLFQTLLHRAFA